MEHPPEIAALVKKYPSLRKPIETGIESHDGREEALFSFICAHLVFENMKNSPSNLLVAIDKFSATHAFMISIGPHKAKILSDLIAKEKPSVVVELGGYLGYSAILFADVMRCKKLSRGGKLRVWSLEMSAEFAAIARKLVEIAGLSDLVTVVVGPAEDSLRKLKGECKLTRLDMLFLDHAEELYASDFKVCEEFCLLKKGTVVVADNMVKPGAPEYRELMRGHPGLRSVGVRGLIHPGDLEDELEISYFTK